jgi:SAM-dependent methyltransferase
MEELRKLHNTCKRELITEWVSPGSYVLDCGCGRGGDMHKWKSVPRVSVVGIDPDMESLVEARMRAQNSNSKMKFIGPGDITDAVQYGPFDVVCYNFALHYIFESPILFQNSVEAIDKCVKPGGLLIGITPDRARMRDFRDTLGNSVTLEGDHALVHLSDGPFYAEGAKKEPLLDANVFIREMQQRNFRLVLWEPMLSRPNGLISDIYSKFVFAKNR